MRTRFFVFIALAVNLALLLVSVGELSISFDEAYEFFEGSKIAGVMARFSCAIFGQNDYALRLPFLLIHFLNLYLLYRLARRLLKQRSDAVFAVLLYAYLPGVMASAVVVNSAGAYVFLTLLSIWLATSYGRYKRALFCLILVLMLFLDRSFLMLYIGLFAYYAYNKKRALANFCIVLAGVNFGLYGFETGGRPSGHFLDTLGIFSAVFSPLVFIYFVYCIYRIWIKEQKNILFFIVTASFAICMLLSIRQRISWEYFLPFCVIATPLMVRSFFASYRVRLAQFRARYKLAVGAVFTFLALNLIAVAFHPYLYLFLDNPKKHFAYKFDIAKQLSDKLKLFDIDAVDTDVRLALRLKFYGIKHGKTSLKNGCDGSMECIEINRAKKVVARFGIAK